MRKFKFTAFVLIVVIIFSVADFSHVFADDNLYELGVLGIAPKSFTEYNIKDAITRGEFAYMAARLIQNSEIAAVNTRFSDVDIKNEYSGYIEFLANLGIVNGLGNGMFDPNGKINLEVACKAIISILGYDEIAKAKGNYSDGYIYLATELGLQSKVATDSDGNLTKAGVVALLHNVLVKEIAGLKYRIVDGELVISTKNDAKYTILGDRMGISVYKGTVSNVNIDGRSIIFAVQGNRYNNNPIMLNNGDELNLKANDNINIYEYDHVPAIIWVDKNEKLVNIVAQKEVTIKYGYIASVNGDSRVNSAYGIHYVNKLTIVDDEDEYGVKSSSTLKFNGKMLTTPTKFVGKFARMVLDNNEVIHIESWDLIEGGIITDIAASSIIYINGENKLRLNEFDAYKSKLFFIGGRCADQKDLKTDSLFYYYKNNDYIVLVVSEKIIIDRFHSIGTDQIELGDSFYNAKNVYYSVKGNEYKSTNDYSDLLDLMVKAYVAPDGNILYVRLDDGQTALLRDFFGVVYGTKNDIFDEEAGQIELWVLDTEITKQKFNITKKTRYNDGLSFATVAANAKNIDGRGVYEFKVNALNNVTLISKPTPYYGYGAETKATITTTFVDNSTSAYVSVASNYLYFTGSSITAIYDLDGQFSVKRVKWNDLYGRNTGGTVTMTFYGEGKESVPSLIILSGDIKNIGSYTLKYGVITGKKRVVDENSNVMCKLSVLMQGEVVEYNVTEELANSLPIYTYITFYDSLKFSLNDIMISSHVDLTMSSNNWPITSFSRGIVEKNDGKRLYFNDGKALFLNPTNKLILSVSEGNQKNRFQGGLSINDIYPGDVIYYSAINAGINTIFVVK